MIKDSGNRREFETGAVRDMTEGKDMDKKHLAKHGFSQGKKQSRH